MATVIELLGGERVDTDAILAPGRRQAVRDLATAIISRETVKGATLANAKSQAAYDILLVMGLLGASANSHEDRLLRLAVRTVIDSL